MGHSINIRVKLHVAVVLQMLSITEAIIIAVTLQALLMGAYFASFLLCLRWLIFSDDGGALRKPIHRPFLSITLILFAFSVTTLGLCLQKTLLFQVSHQVSSTTTLLNYIRIINVGNLRTELLMD